MQKFPIVALLSILLLNVAAVHAWNDAWRDKYPVGSTVLASPVSDASDWRKATVVENVRDGLLRVRVEAGNGRPGGVYIISGESDIKPLSAAAQSVPGHTNAPGTQGGISTKGNLSVGNLSVGNLSAGNSSLGTSFGGFKIGETVLASPSLDDKDWRKGVIVENDPAADFMRVNMEAGNGRVGGVQIVSRSSIRKMDEHNNNNGTQHANPTPAAIAQPKDSTVKQPGANCCPPQANLSGSSLEMTFKRSIHDRYIENGRSFDVGRYPATITFHNFSVSGPRPYRMPEEYAYHTGSPDGPGGKEGTQVYEVRTKFTVCVDELPSSQSYKGYVNFVDHDAKYFAFKHYTTGEWLLNQDSDKIDRRQVAK